MRLLISFCCLILSVYGGKAPFITPCTWSDEKCILTSSQQALPIIAAGLPELGVPSADPLMLNNVKLEQDELKLFFKDIKITGIKKCQIQSASRDTKASTISIVIDCPIEAVGDYTAEGKLLFIPVEGSGPFNITCDKLRVSMVSNIEVVDGSDGKKHWKITNTKYTHEPLEKFYIDFKNLFNGDEKKAEPILKIFDSNWKDLILGIGKPIIDEVVLQITNVVQKFYDAVPSDELEIA